MPFPELTPDAAQAELERFLIIDVREEHEFHGPLGFVDGARLIPLSTVAEHSRKLSGARPLLLVCRSGKRSGKACEALQNLGVGDVTNLAGGMIAWNRAGLPLRHSEPTTLAELRDSIVSWVAQVSPPSEEAARDVLRQQAGRESAPYDEPSHSALGELLDFVADSLGEINPPDLDLSLAFFRSSLAAL